MASVSAGTPSPNADFASAESTALWQRLLAAGSDEEFCTAWLALMCLELDAVGAGVVLLQLPGAETFAPVALWPDAPRDLSRFGAVAHKALGEARGVVQRAGEQANAPWHVAYPLRSGSVVLGAVALEISACPEAHLHALLRRLHWGLGCVHERLARRFLEATDNKLQRIGSVLEVVSAVLGRASLRQTLLEITNLVTRELGASRAAIGLAERSAVRIAAISDAAWFESNAGTVKSYVAAMEEALDRLAVVTYHAAAEAAEPNAPELGAAPEHAALVRATGARSVTSVPLLVGARCVGVLTVEWDRDGSPPSTDLDWLDALAGLLPAAIEQKRQAERNVVARLRDDLRWLAARFFGPRHLAWKLCGALAAVVLLALVFVDAEYRVNAKTVIEGEVQRAAVAPFGGYVAEAYVRAGDVVSEGQVLYSLEEHDLRLERDRWASEREQRLRELRVAMAEHDLTEVQIVGAQVRQAEAQLSLVEEKLARSRVQAPFDGIVISGDLSQLIGSPVEPGEKLFEIAPLAGYRVVLQVDENDIREVRVGQRGRLLVAGIAGETLPFSVSKVTPVASAADGRNFFRVEARLDSAPINLRPGMQGVGKIDAGKRRLWWIVTHDFTNWLRIALWRWTP
ncbi:MAG TPA: HlyD family efflux transporter periplasmic adaptor subunit [Gammaproteobacteria bacterium]|nr:HlyD family efflux transporter periplasmic adaptor subunit [Gammaproteobacteria bacterium]